VQARYNNDHDTTANIALDDETMHNLMSDCVFISDRRHFISLYE